MGKSKEALQKLTPEQRAHERLIVAECALTALISTHPNASEVRRQFDQLYARHQLSRAKHGAPIEAHAAMQGLIDMLFQSKE